MLPTIFKGRHSRNTFFSVLFLGYTFMASFFLLLVPRVSFLCVDSRGNRFDFFVCLLQWDKSATTRYNAGNHDRPPGWETGAAAGGNVHPHRRGRPQDRSGHQEKLPPQLQHRQRFPLLPSSRITAVTFPMSQKLKLQSSHQACCTEPSASSSSTARRSCCSSRGRTPRSLFQVRPQVLESCRLTLMQWGRAAVKSPLMDQLVTGGPQCRRGGVAFWWPNSLEEKLGSKAKLQSINLWSPVVCSSFNDS